MKTFNQQRFSISKDQLLQLSLETIKKDHFLFQLTDATDDQAFWFSINRKQLTLMAEFINEYVQDN